MQTILGSSGQIGQELAKELYKNYTHDIRLVSRNPRKVNPEDQLHPANLLNFEETNQAVAGSEIVYFTAGLPMNSDMWTAQFPIMIDNVIRACQINHSKLVFFDNTYMYAKNATPQTENSPFQPDGQKATARAKMAQTVIDAMQAGQIETVICRAPEFYGPAKTNSITNTLLFNKIKAGQKARIPVSDQFLRTLIWTPDASRAMALIGNTPDAYGQTWHLPCADSITYKGLVELIQEITYQPISYSIIKMWQFKLASFFNQNSRELQELLPRYQADNIFVSDKFKTRFPEFKITSFEEGIREILTV